MFKNVVIAMMVLGTLAVASCSGGAGAPLDEMNTQNVGTSQADQDLSSSIQWEAQVGEEPGIPEKVSSDFNFDPILDWDLIWEAMHNPVVSGDNEIDLGHYMGHSAGSSYGSQILGWLPGFPPSPIYGMGLFLPTPEGGSGNSYATFGLSGIPVNQQLKRVSLKGYGHGVYVGVSDFSNNSYRWFGPVGLDSGEAVEINLPLMDSRNSDGKTYITILANHQSPTVTAMNVGIGDKFEIQIPDVQIDFPISPIYW